MENEIEKIKKQIEINSNSIDSLNEILSDLIDTIRGINEVLRGK